MSKSLIIIPAFNEEKNIGWVIQEVKNCLPEKNILVVDDGSHDQTAKIAENHGAEIISHPFNLGYGVALQTGYKYAVRKNYDFVAQIDADGQHEPSFLPHLLEIVKNGEADIVLGSRFLRKTHAYKIGFLRRVGMWIFSQIISFLIKQKLTDPTTGFQAFNQRVVKFYTSDAYPADFPDADVLLMLHFAGFKIKEVPVKMHSSPTGKSMHQGLKPIYYVFKMFLSIFLTLFREKKNFKEL